MNQDTKPTIPFWYWIIAAVGLIWNLMGCVTFGMEVFAQEALMESWTDEQKEWARSIPRWIYFVYFFAVTSGVVGSVGLFMRKRWAVEMFSVCLAAVIVQMIYTVLISGGLKVMGPSSLIMPSLVVVIAGALLWFSRFARTRGWIR